MAQFSIYLVSPRGQFNLTNYDSVKGLLLGNTFDEQINLSVDDSSFVFSMLKYRYQGSAKVINELALRIEYGSVVRVEIGGRNYAFSVMNIDYTFLADNLQLTFTCQDTFQACVSKLGIGYTISDDVNDSDYLGAQSIDDWAYKIVRDNNIDWTYVSIDSANADAIIRLASDSDIAARDNLSTPAAWEAIDAEYIESLRPNPATLNLSVSFSCSDSNAYEALKTLATQNELVIQNDYATRRFWFEPRKSPIFKGYYVRPDINLQSLSLQGRGENLATILNVTGPTDVDGNEITLVPSLPPKVQAFIETPEWLTSNYYPNLYRDLYSTEAEKNQDAVFLRQIAAVPWLENKLINIDYFKDRHLLTYEASEIENILNNELRIVNGRLMNAARHFFVDQEKWMQTFNKIESEGEVVLAHVIADIQSTYDQLYDLTRLKTIYNDTSVHRYESISDFPSTGVNGDYYYARSTHEFRIYISGVGYQTPYLFTLPSVKWPLFFYLYEDTQGTQFYCAPKYLAESQLVIRGQNVDGTEFLQASSSAPLPELNNASSFPVSAADKVAYMEITTSNSTTALSSRLHWPQGVTTNVFTSFLEALHFRQKVLSLLTDPVVDLDTFLQERAAKQESLYQLLLENTYKFQQELATSFDFYVRMHNVGVVTDLDGKIVDTTAYVTTSDRINMLDTTTFSQDQINYLYDYFSDTPRSGDAPNGHVTRDAIISKYVSIEGSLTQYWQVMRSCGLKLGFFFPETWNCLEILELLQDDFVEDVTHIWLHTYTPTLLPLRYNSNTNQYTLNNAYGPSNVVPHKDYAYRFKFYDQQRQVLQPLRTLYNATNRSHTNTDSNYEIITSSNRSVLNLSPYFYLYYNLRNQAHVSSVLELYTTRSKAQQTIYAPSTGSYLSIAYTDSLDMLSAMCSVYGAEYSYTFTGWNIHTSESVRNEFNPTRSLSACLAQHEIANTNYYKYQVAHNKIWQKLYANYPGIFRESSYVNETATNTTELYNSALAQLKQLSQPEFAYNISALDIYMYNQDLLPMNLHIGDQIRIDYQDEPTRFDSVNKALRESLFVTGIRHTLRTDGDYQLTVETRRATDIMVQRFAQLLSGGR